MVSVLAVRYKSVDKKNESEIFKIQKKFCKRQKAFKIFFMQKISQSFLGCLKNKKNIFLNKKSRVENYRKIYSLH